METISKQIVNFLREELPECEINTEQEGDFLVFFARIDNHVAGKIQIEKLCLESCQFEQIRCWIENYQVVHEIRKNPGNIAYQLIQGGCDE